MTITNHGILETPYDLHAASSIGAQAQVASDVDVGTRGCNQVVHCRLLRQSGKIVHDDDVVTRRTGSPLPHVINRSELGNWNPDDTRFFPQESRLRTRVGSPQWSPVCDDEDD